MDNKKITGECCGKPMQYSTESKCNYNDCCMNEYCGCKLGRIKEMEPTCDSTAVIPSVTVQSIDGITNLANCLVHVEDTNTTYYVDDKHRIMITWAGPVDIPGYDMETNPNKYKDQIVTDVEKGVAVIYDKHGKGYLFGITPESLQEAVNNKLDEMAEDGTLGEIISSYLEDAVLGFDTVADMKASTNLVAGDYARTLGFHSLNDGGGALYKITNTGTANEMDIIAVGPTLYASLVRGTENLNIKQFGAYGDNTHDDTEVLQHCIDYAYQSKIKVINIPEGVYLISQPLEIYENENYDLNMEKYDHVERHADKGYPVSKLIFQGADMNNTMLKATAGDYLFNGYATTPVGIQDLTFNDIFFNGNNIAKTVIQMDIVHFGGRDIQFFRCNFNSFTECAIQDIITSSKISSAPLRNQLRLLIDNCIICNNKNGLIVGGDDTIIRHCIIGKNEEYGIILTGSVHMMTIQECKIQYNGQSKAQYAGGQIRISCSGSAVNFNNNYFENKSSVYSNNDTGIIVFTTDDINTTRPKIEVINFENNYINIGQGPAFAERITAYDLVTLSFKNNFVTELWSDTVYIFKTNVPDDSGITLSSDTSGNRVRAKSSDGETTIDYWYLTNDNIYSQSGLLKSEFGLWGANTTTDLRSQMPTIIAGSITSANALAMRKVGDYTNTKDGVGRFVITFTRPLSDETATFNNNYPVFVSLLNPDPFTCARVISKDANGFIIETGTWNSDFTVFTKSNIGFDFVAFFLTKV